MTTNADLLNSLKIDRNAAPPPASRAPLWIALAVVAALALGLGAWLGLRGGGVEVQVAQATAIGSGGASAAAVLDATGYVVARRMATVSAKVTGKVREVLIEEGQRVEEGQVLARLDAQGLASVERLAATGESAGPDQVLLPLRRLKHGWTLVTDAYHFPEGQEPRFRQARYGEFRVLPGGRALLVGLADADLRLIDPVAPTP